MTGHVHWLKYATGVGMAAGLMLAAIVPSYAQGTGNPQGGAGSGSQNNSTAPPTASPPPPAPILANWSAGPGAQGNSTYIGRVETPRIGQIVSNGNGLLVGGWVADTTAQGWAGIDSVEVWAGDKANGGTQLGTGPAGLPRPDIGDIIGGTFANSGFSLVVPSSKLSTLPAGNVELRLYVHTPNKGWWYRATTVTDVQAPVIPYPNDPVVYIAKPQDGTNVTQRQAPAGQLVMSGAAYDRNPLSAVQNSLSLLAPGVGQALSGGCPACQGGTNHTYTQFRGPGVDYITAYVDAPPAPGTQSFATTGTPCAGCVQGVVILVNNKGFINRSDKPQGSVITDGAGVVQTGDPEQFRWGGWVYTVDPRALSPGWHTLYVTAHSTVTGKTSPPATAKFNIIQYNPGQPIQP